MDRIGNREPSAEELAKIKKALPFLKKQVSARAKKNGSVRSAIIGKMIDPTPCQICMTTFDKYNGGSKVKPDFCPACCKNLASGQVCFCSVANGVYDGRFIFATPDDTEHEMPDGSKLKMTTFAGSVLHIPSQTMDKMMAKHESESEKN